MISTSKKAIKKVKNIYKTAKKLLKSKEKPKPKPLSANRQERRKKHNKKPKNPCLTEQAGKPKTNLSKHSKQLQCVLIGKKKIKRGKWTETLTNKAFQLVLVIVNKFCEKACFYQAEQEKKTQKKEKGLNSDNYRN